MSNCPECKNLKLSRMYKFWKCHERKNSGMGQNVQIRVMVHNVKFTNDLKCETLGMDYNVKFLEWFIM